MNEREQMAGQEASDANAEVGMLGEPLTDRDMTDDELIAACRADVDAATNPKDEVLALCRGMRRLTARLEQEAYEDGCNTGIYAVGQMMAEEASRMHP